MSSNKLISIPNDLPNDKKEKIPAFGKKILDYMNGNQKKEKMNQKNLALKSNLNEPRVSRIINGKDVVITFDDVNALAIALTISPEERNELLYIVWPSLRIIDEALKSECRDVNKLKELLYIAWPSLRIIDKALNSKCGDVNKLNEELYEEGLPLLGNSSIR